MPKISSAQHVVPVPPSFGAEAAAPESVKVAPASAGSQAKPVSLEQRILNATRTPLNRAALERQPSVGLGSSRAAMPALERAAPKGLKSAFYLPTSHTNINLNCMVTLRPEEAEDDRPNSSSKVQCRHLAMEYFNAPKKSAYLESVNSEARLTRYFSGGKLRASQQQVTGMVSQATSRNTNMVSLDKFPEQVRDIARMLTAKRQTNADFLIVNGHHARALNVKIKDAGRVCVTLYNPNNTGNHSRLEARDCNDLDTLRQLIVHFRDLEDDGHAFAFHARHDMFNPEQAMNYLQAGAKSTPTQVTESAMNIAFKRNDPTLTLQLVAKAVSEHPRGGRSLKEALAGTCNGFPGFFTALLDGHTSTVSAWMSQTANLAERGLLKPDEVFELFRAEGGTSNVTRAGLIGPMLKKNSAVIGQFLAQVNDAAGRGVLKRDHVKALFCTPNAVCGSGINLLFRNRDVASLNAVVEQLVRAHQQKVLSGSDVKKVLQWQKSHDRYATPPAVTARQLEELTQVMQPLVSRGAMKPDDVNQLFVAHGLVEKSGKSLASKIFR